MVVVLDSLEKIFQIKLADSHFQIFNLVELYASRTVTLSFVQPSGCAVYKKERIKNHNFASVTNVLLFRLSVRK